MYTQKYYDKIAKNESGSFLNRFDIAWNEFLDNMNLKYTNSSQLHVGNRLRPIMTCWGYLHCHNIDAPIDFHYIADIAVSLEALHKASVIIDDVIDGDTMRRGTNCLHVEYSENEAVFFSVCMISSAIDNLNQKLKMNNNKSLGTNTVSLLCNTIFLMCKGALMEITSTEPDRLNKKRIKDIIDLETSTLLKNSLLIGYIASDQNYNPDMRNVIEKIGDRCGFIFQVLNDLEPFCNPKYIKEHKGNLNSDYLKSRKNIVIPYMYEVLSAKEQKNFEENLNNSGNFDVIQDIFEKKQLRNYIMNDIVDLHKLINKEIDTMALWCNNTLWLTSFKDFVAFLIDYCISVLDGNPIKWN